jgi:copper resistance protein B
MRINHSQSLRPRTCCGGSNPPWIAASLTLLAMTLFFYPAFASDHSTHADMASEHGGGVFHMFRSETEAGSSSKGDAIEQWDLDGWIGTDENKLWLKSEGERKSSTLESAEFWALYSRNVSTFWDVQAGLRYDVQPESTAYLTLGVNGLAPYWFDTEAHLFVSEKGDVTVRLREENDVLITQKLILQPYLEVNLSAQDVHELGIGRGITDGTLGLQTRYEFTRAFAPYIDVHFDQKFGQTASIARSEGEDAQSLVGTVGLRLTF